MPPRHNSVLANNALTGGGTEGAGSGLPALGACLAGKPARPLLEGGLFRVNELPFPPKGTGLTLLAPFPVPIRE